MSDIMIWHEPERDRWFLERGSKIEELFPLTRDYISDLEDENAKLRERVTELEGLNELVNYMTSIAWYAASERERDELIKLGLEVD